MPELPSAPSLSWQVREDDTFTIVTVDLDGAEVEVPLLQVSEEWHMRSDYPGLWVSGPIPVRGCRVHRADRSQWCEVAALPPGHHPSLRLYDVTPA